MRAISNTAVAAMWVLLVVGMTTQALAIDSDGDGIPDEADNCMFDANPLQCDTDGDGFGNTCDFDLNQDGFPSLRNDDENLFNTDLAAGMDSGIGSDFNCDGVVGPSDLAWLLVLRDRQPPILGPSGYCPFGLTGCFDLDGDGIYSAVDNCSDVANPSQCDSDGDGYGNHCDGDLPTEGAPLGDGAVGANDLAAVLTDFQSGTNSGTGTDLNCDGAVGANDLGTIMTWFSAAKQPGPSALPCAGTADCLDSDQDSWVDTIDNCVDIANVDQADVDQNGVGDVCEISVVRRQDVMSDWMVDEWGVENTRSGSFRAVSLPDGRIAGFYVAGSFDGAIEVQNYTPYHAVHYFEETAANGPVETFVAWETPTGQMTQGLSLDVAIDSAGRACASFISKPTSGNPLIPVVCRTPDGFDVKLAGGADPSAVNLSGTVTPRVAFDSANNPVIAVYQHGIHQGVNHRVRLLRFDGGTWVKSTLPVPDALGLLDGASKAPCIHVDSSDRAHVMFSAHDDQTCPNCTQIVDSAMVYMTGDVGSSFDGWVSEIVMEDLLGDSNGFEAGYCADLTIAPDGRIHAVYSVATATPIPPDANHPNGGWGDETSAEVHHVVKSGASWVDRKLEDGMPWRELKVDGAGNLYSLGGSGIRQVSLKLDLASGPHAGLHSHEVPLGTVSNALRSGVSLLLREPPGGGGATECIVVDAAVREGTDSTAAITLPTKVSFLTIDACNDAYLGLPLADY